MTKIAELTDDRISRLLAPYLPVAPARGNTVSNGSFFDQVRAYIYLLLKWNRSISLTAVTDPEEIIRFHFGESIFATSLVQFQNGRLADFGSGAGFPGLPIRMAVASAKVSLVESNLKKCAFLSEVCRELSFRDVRVKKYRIESLETADSVDFITARALGQFELLLQTARRLLVTNGRVILWLGEGDCESLARRVDWDWLPPVHVPDSERRFILVGSPKTSLFHVEQVGVRK